MFQLFFWGIVILIFLIFLRLITYWIVVIPAKHFSILEQLNQFHSVLLPGTHFVLWPVQGLKIFRMTEIQQNGSKKKFESTEITMTGNQIDFPPISCSSKDKVELKVDLVCFYNVVDVAKFAYENNDPSNFFYQNVIQCVKTVCYNFHAQDIQVGNYTSITDRLTELLNEKNSVIGLKCTQILIQDISVSKTVSDKDEAAFASKRQQEILQLQEKAIYERELLQLENEKNKTDLKNKTLLEQQKTELLLSLNEAKAEKERRDILGETPEYLLKREWYQSMKKCFEESNRVVLAPLEYFANPSRLLIQSAAAAEETLLK
jgi:regulator of protease activity HflC (stomatin/prohibitin superfamily)